MHLSEMAGAFIVQRKATEQIRGLRLIHLSIINAEPISVVSFVVGNFAIEAAAANITIGFSCNQAIGGGVDLFLKDSVVFMSSSNHCGR